MQGASLQCMQATEMDFSPGTPSFRVTTRRRLTPQGTSCSFLQAVTQPLHSMQRSASQMNFIRAMCVSLRGAIRRVPRCRSWSWFLASWSRCRSHRWLAVLTASPRTMGCSALG